MVEPALATDHLVDDIGRRSRRGGAVLLLAQLIRVFAQIATLMVLARLLPPAAFGLLAMVAAIALVLDLIKDLGLSTATIQKPGVTHGQVSALFWINTAVGAFLAAVLWLSAPALARFYDEPELTQVARWLALGFVLSGLTVQHWALLRRQMRFVAIAGIETTADVAAFTVAIIVALAGEGYWALVAQRLVSPAILLIACWSAVRWRPARPATTTGMHDLLRFGASVTASGLAAVFARSIDQILIGWLWGAASLGLYERTTRLIMLPVNTINAPVYAVGMPALSRLVDQPGRYRLVFDQMMQKLALLTMPVFALVCVTADWVVAILLGPSWSEAAPLVAFSALSAFYLPVLMAVGLLYLTQNRTGELVRAALVDSVLCIASILAGLHWGVAGVAASVAATGLLVRTPVAFWLATRRGPVSLGSVYGAIAPAATAAPVAAGVAWFMRQTFLPGESATVGGVLLVGATALASIVLVVSAWPETRREVWGVIRRCMVSASHKSAVFIRLRRSFFEP